MGKGITKSEILIVVAILAVLTAVVIPNVIGLIHRMDKLEQEEQADTDNLSWIGSSRMCDRAIIGWDEIYTGNTTWGTFLICENGDIRIEWTDGGLLNHYTAIFNPNSRGCYWDVDNLEWRLNEVRKLWGDDR